MATDARDALQLARSGADAGPVFLNDGLCPFCDWTLRVLRADRRRMYRFAPIEGDLARHCWGLLGALALVPRALRDCAYDVFARNRYRLFRLEVCPIPPREVR